MSFADAFAQIALAVSAQVGGPFASARILDPGTPVTDDGGSIVEPGTPTQRTCNVQIDLATDEMRADAGFVQGDARFMILAGTLSGSVGTDARVEVLDGLHVGLWMISALERDPAGIGWVGRGRRG